MLYFTPEGQIPAGEGFTLLGWQHLLMLAILGAFLLGMLVFHGIWDIRNFFYLQMGLPLMRSLVLALLAGLPLNGFIVWSLQRNIYSESVYAAMRLGE